jgi:hypothetical protein
MIWTECPDRLFACFLLADSLTLSLEYWALIVHVRSNWQQSFDYCSKL